MTAAAVSPAPVWAVHRWYDFDVDWAEGYGVELVQITKAEFVSGRGKSLRDAVFSATVGGALLMFDGQTAQQENTVKKNGFWMATTGAVQSTDRRDRRTPRPDFRIKSPAFSRMTNVLAGVYLLPNDYRMGMRS